MASNTTHEKVNILLVDDQESRLLTYDTILRELDQNLVHAHSGFEALQCIMSQEFAVVVLDVSMPGMDGFETAALIHEHPRFERTPIIFVTGVHVTELECLQGYKLGAIDYVNVPVMPEILRGTKVIRLDENHRCTPQVVAVATAVLRDSQTDETVLGEIDAARSSRVDGDNNNEVRRPKPACWNACPH